MSNLTSGENNRIHKSIDRNDTNHAELKLQKRILTPLMNKKVPPLPAESEHHMYPVNHANIISKVFFWWLHPIMTVGYKRTLESADLWHLEDDLKVEYYYSRFAAHFDAQTAKAKAVNAKMIEEKKLKGVYNSEEDDEVVYPKYSLVYSLFHTFRWEYSLAIVFAILGNTSFVVTPLLAKALINFVEQRAKGGQVNISHGIGYAIGSSVMVLVAGLFSVHFIHSAMMVGAKTKSVLTKAVLDKSLRLNRKARQKFPAGKITSILGTDLARVDLGIGFQPFVIAFPFSTAISIALLVVNIGVASLVGIVLFVGSVATIGYCTKKLYKYRKSAQKFTDSRVDLVKELLGNSKLIKFYNWGDFYAKTIRMIRNSEMKLILKMQLLRSFITSYAVSLPQISSVISFLVMYAISKNKNTANIFASLGLFNVLAQQIMTIPLALSSGSDALIAIYRVTELLQSGEVNREEQGAFYKDVESLEKENLAVKVSNADFEWIPYQDEDAETENTKAENDANSQEESKKATFKGLTNINLEIQKGDFVVVTGPIGSGKSSFLNALAGVMHKTSGSVKINGSLLLSGQPWIQNVTVRDNILFGSDYDENMYRDIIYACSLDADLEILPAGDSTEIGERGITLSGGQKARMNLARAVYAKKDIILLDDVLSAVDAKVGKHIMDRCLLGLLAKQTRILATHQLSLIGYADKVIFLNGDGTVDVGTVAELTARNEIFRKLMSYNTESADKTRDEASATKDTIVGEGERENHQITEDGRLMQKEDRAVNSISLTVYRNYMALGSDYLGIAAVITLAAVIFLTTFSQLFTNVWLSFWTADYLSGKTNSFYIGIYVMLTVATVLLSTSEFTLIVMVANRAAKVLYARGVQRLTRAPMSFIETTPMGRILNRFTKDIDALDNEISEQLKMFIYPLANIIGVVILCIIYLPWFAIAVPFIVLLFVCISSFYQASAREIKRLEAIQRSFVFSNFSEMLNGFATIRAYGAEQTFIKKNNLLLNKMNEAYFVTIANQRWLSVHLDIVATILAFVVSLLCVTHQFNISAASVGLLLSYVLQISNQLSGLIRAMTAVENEMNSVERLCHYAYDLEQEAAYEISETKPSPEWPHAGQIEFKDVSLRYRAGLPLVLKRINFKVGAGQKIGICGRTGAGKTSIMTAVFRIAEISGGSIIVDGVDISRIGLHDLRSKLSIIPQDPVLFKGSIRKNLDPFSNYSDEKLWEALHKSGLIEDIHAAKTDSKNSHKFHLNQVVEDDGDNFSLGEKQLIALARAVVRDSKILILDEATSSVDYETDAKVQSTIFREFRSSTILCIAHRLKTILDYDKVLVLDQGEVKEFDTPWHLFNHEGGIFQSMCERSNITCSDFHNM